VSPATSSTLSSPAAASLAASIIRGSTRAATVRSDRSSSSFRASRLPMNPGYPVSSARAIRDLRRSPSCQSAPAEGPHGPGTGRPGAALQHDRETQVAVAPSPPQLVEGIGIPRLRDLAVEPVDLAAQLHLGRSDTGVTQDLVAQAHVRRDPGHVLELERLAASGQRIEVAALDRVLDLCLGDAGEDAQRAYLTPWKLPVHLQLADRADPEPQPRGGEHLKRTRRRPTRSPGRPSRGRGWITAGRGRPG